MTKVIFEQTKNDYGTFAWNIYDEDGRYLGRNLSITGKDAGIENIKEIQ